MDKKIKIAELSIVIAVTLFLLLLPFTRSEVSNSDLETINGIPFYETIEGVIVSEKLAHSDIYLTGSPLGKALTLSITFSPKDTETLSVGIRENSFWLSYPKHELYNSLSTSNLDTKKQTKVITIPLTDKLVDKNGSVDLMFFATNVGSKATENEGVSDNTNWILHNLETKISYRAPTKAELKDYIKSRVTKEVAL